MKNLIRFFTVTFIFLTAAQTIAAQTTAFNYQGKLTDAGTPQSSYQMQFKLFDSLTGGNQIGETIENPSVAVEQGVFSVRLDFGASAFSGADRFLEISVRRNSNETYITLNPRQQIASSPYSIRTLSAQTADVALDAQKLGGINASEYVTTSTVGNSFIRNQTTQQTANFNISGNGFVGGNFGIGTTNPTDRLQVAGAVKSLTNVSTHMIVQTTGGENAWARYYMRTNNRSWFIGTSQIFNGDQFYLVDETGNQSRMTIQPNGGAITFPFGNVGIGTTNPSARLNVSNLGSTSPGILAEVDTTTAFAIRGNATAFNSVGVKGEANAGQGIGVWGQSNTNTGVYGLTTSGVGVYAASTGSGRAIHADGNVTQSLAGFGLPKAMVFVRANGTIARCYNGTTGASITSGNTTNTGCGFTATRFSTTFGPTYRVDFPFEINGSFASLTSYGSPANITGRIYGMLGSAITMYFFTTSQDPPNSADSDFILIVY